MNLLEKNMAVALTELETQLSDIYMYAKQNKHNFISKSQASFALLYFLMDYYNHNSVD